MSDIDLAVTHSKRLEALLDQNLGAIGKGLHEKVSSVAGRLPADLVRRIHLVATVRNKIVHQDDYKTIDDRPTFLAASKSAEKELAAMGSHRGSMRVHLKIAAALLLIAIIGVATWWHLH